jgi:hypothetical protein
LRRVASLRAMRHVGAVLRRSHAVEIRAEDLVRVRVRVRVRFRVRFRVRARFRVGFRVRVQG